MIHPGKISTVLSGEIAIQSTESPPLGLGLALLCIINSKDYPPTVEGQMLLGGSETWDFHENLNPSSIKLRCLKPAGILITAT